MAFYRLWLLSPLVYLAVALAKARYVVSAGLWESPAQLFLATIRADCAPLAVLFFLAAVAALRSSIRTRWLLATVSVLVCATYWLDTMAIFVFNQRLSWTDLRRWAPDTDAWSTYRVHVAVAVFVLLGMGVALLARRRDFSEGRSRKVAAVLTSLAVIAGLLATPKLDADVAEYAFGRSLPSISSFVGRSPAAVASCDAACEPLLEVSEDFQAVPKQRNIILVVVESLGALTSRRLGGAIDGLPELDALVAAKGTTFRNYVANNDDSWNGFFAIFGGVVPLPWLRDPEDRHSWWARMKAFPSPVEGLKKHGYRTHLASAYRWSNEAVLKFGRAAGFDRIEWPGNSPVLRVSLSDENLYRLGSDAVTAWKGKSGHFLALVTGSTHEAFLNPEAWHRADRALAAFVHELERQKFFESGWLLVTGDHRQRVPATEGERRAPGRSGVARVPLFAFGPEFAAGRVDDRFHSHSRLLRRLADLPRPEVPLGDQTIFVPYTRSIAQRVRSLVFRKGIVVQRPGMVDGLSWTWDAEGPPDFEPHRERIEKLRAALDCLSQGQRVLQLCDRTVR